MANITLSSHHISIVLLKAVVRNSLIANEWGNEEREGKIPFEKATGFDLEIKNEEYAFQVTNLNIFETFIVSS